MFDKVEVGLIGCGLMGSQHARHLVEIEGANLRALADVNLDAAKRLKQEAGGKYCTSDPQDLFNDEKIDLVVTDPQSCQACQVSQGRNIAYRVGVEPQISHISQVSQGRDIADRVTP